MSAQKKVMKVLVTKRNDKKDQNNSQDDLVYAVMARTGQSEATVREVLNRFAEVLADSLDEHGQLFVEGTKDMDWLLKKTETH